MEPIFNLILNKEQLKIVEEALYGINSLCYSGCFLPEMEQSDKDCSECKLTKTTEEILEQIGKLKENNVAGKENG